MGKGIKMRSATDALGNARTIEALQVLHDDHQTIPNLVCGHAPCGCAVRFVPRSQQNRSNRIEPVDVPAYIGLTSSSEHVAACLYDAPGRFKTIIAAQSDPDFVKALDDGRRELRLLALHNGLRAASLSGYAPETGMKPPSSIAPRNSTPEFLQSEKRLSSYLSTTADLVTLRAMCESDEFLSSELILRLGTKRVPWKQFFFERERYDEAWELLRAGGNNTYPIALAGVVKSHYMPPAGSPARNSILNCRSLYRRPDSADTMEAFEVNVMHPDSARLGAFPVGSAIVMFGLWKAADPVAGKSKRADSASRATTFLTHKLTLFPKFKRQVAEVV